MSEETELTMVINAFDYSAYYQIPVKSLIEAREQAATWELDAEIFVSDTQGNEIERLKEFDNPDRTLSDKEIASRMMIDSTGNTRNITYADHIKKHWNK